MVEEKNINKNDDIEKLLKEIKKLNDINNSPKNVVLRALTTGLFTSLGATFGLAIFAFILGYFLNLIGEVPYLSDFYINSGLKTIVDYQLSQIQKEEQQTTPTPTPEVTHTAIPTITVEPTYTYSGSTTE